MNKCFKFGFLKNDVDQPFFYDDAWLVEKYPNYERVKVAPHDDHITLMLDILKNFEPPYYCLYVLLVSRTDNEVGRYQCPQPLTYKELHEFANSYKSYLETDGRHHFWMGSVKTKQLLVYDHHNLIYVYDAVEKTKQYLNNKGFTESLIELPVPHTHMYNPENDVFEQAIMRHWEWVKFPLNEQD